MLRGNGRCAMKAPTRKKTAKARATTPRAARLKSHSLMRKQLASALGCTPHDVTGDTVPPCFHALWRRSSADERMIIWMAVMVNITVKLPSFRAKWYGEGAE